jgi:hypothetical protein
MAKAKLGTGARFRALTKKLRKKGARTPEALAAFIGRKKLRGVKVKALPQKIRRKK